MYKRDRKYITPNEFAELLGKKNPESIREGLKAGTFPIGMAFKTFSGGWVYFIPREPAEYFARTGRIPE